MQLLERNNSG